jgi:hypothetical protein
MEITRTELLNNLAKWYNLNDYLEIGVQDKKQNFDKIICERKVSVDPDIKAKADYVMTSDEYFDLILNDQFHGGRQFDLIFIDGLHHSDQVEKDFINAQKVLKKGGFIVLHDCNPQYEQHTIVPRQKPSGHWNGDVYRFACKLSNKLTIDIDNGCLVATKETQITNKNVHWIEFHFNRVKLLNLIRWYEFTRFNSHVQRV